MKVLSTFKRTSQGITLMALLGLVSFSSLIQINSKKASQLRLFQEGMQTCFSRVAQSFTARTIGDLSSNYIGSEFKGFTEECFGEVLVAFETIETTKATEILTQTNNINQEVYELHKKINATTPFNTPEDVLLSNIGARYEKLEVKRDNVLELVDQSLNVLTAKRNNLKIFFYFFSFVTPVLILLTLMRNIRRERVYRGLEKEAKELIEDNSFQAAKVETLIGNALKEFDLGNMKVLFETYRTRNHENNSTADSVGPSVFLNPKKDVESQITKAWTDNTKSEPVKLETENITNLEESVRVVIDSLTDKLLTMGVIADFNLKKSLVSMNKEDLDQIIYHGLTGLLNESEAQAQNRRLNISLNSEKEKSRLRLSYTGSSLENRVVEQYQSSGKLTDNIELSICQQLLTDNGGVLTIENREGGEARITTLSLEFSRAPRSKLVDVKRTTKKQWMNSSREIY